MNIGWVIESLEFSLITRVGGGPVWQALLETVAFAGDILPVPVLNMSVNYSAKVKTVGL